MSLALGAFVALTAAWMIAEAAVAHREPDLVAPRERATGLALLALHAGAVAEHLARGSAVPGWAMALGAAAIAAGVGLRVAAIVALGPRFASTTAAPDRLVDDGPYRWLRHPSEIGLLAIAAGTALLLGSVIGVAVAALVLAPLSVLRCTAEDAELARRFEERLPARHRAGVQPPR